MGTFKRVINRDKIRRQCPYLKVSYALKGYTAPHMCLNITVGDTLSPQYRTFEHEGRAVNISYNCFDAVKDHSVPDLELLKNANAATADALAVAALAMDLIKTDKEYKVIIAELIDHLKTSPQTGG